MKRLLFFICTLLCANVLMAQTTFWIDSLQYKITSTNPAEVEVYSSNQSIVIADIPATVTYEETTYSVTAIGYEVFKNRNSLISITIPESITSINSLGIFLGCSNLRILNFNAINCADFEGYYPQGGYAVPITSLNIGNNVQRLPACFMSNADSLTSVNIPNSVIEIGSRAFWCCDNLTSVTLPENATISTNAFTECGPNAGLTIDNGVIYTLCYDNDNIGNYTFEDVYNVTFTIGDSVYTPSSAMVYYYTSELSGGVTLLSSITYNGVTYPVTSIDYTAFENCSNLTSITIPNSVISIENNAFKNCSNLTSVNIGNGVTSIGAWAFQNCSNLTSVTIPNSVTSIGNRAFRNCSSLTSVTCLAETAPSISVSVFTSTPSNKTLSYPCGSDYSAWESATTWASVERIGCEEEECVDVFTIGDLTYEKTSATEVSVKDCSETATEVIIPASVEQCGITYSVTSIGNYSFQYCDSLTSINIPNSVTSIGNSAFYGCDSLTSIDIPNSVTSIGNYAFSDCSSLTSVTIGNSVTSIGERAFYFCTSLTSVTIPNSVTSIGEHAFAWCISLTSVTIGNSVTSIGDYAFQWCNSLTSIDIPNSVTSIGYKAFDFCTSLTSVTIPNSVTSIGARAFAGCHDLTSVTIGNSVTSIGNNAFNSCSSLTSVTCLAETAPSLGDSVFIYTPSTKVLNITCGSDYSSWESATDWASVECTWDLGNSLTYFPLTFAIISGGERTMKVSDCDTSATVVEIPARVMYNGVNYSVTSIGNDAFTDCHSLTSVTIPNSVTSIGNSAFKYCYDLTSVTIPNSVTSIGNSAFSSCRNLTSVTIPNSVTSIGNYAFSSCRSLTSVDIPNSVTSIGNGTFDYCESLTSVTIPNSVTSIGNYAFNHCNLTSVDIPNSVTSIGNYAFFYCDSLIYVDIPNSVISLGNRAFGSCFSLTSVTIPNSVTSIGSEAFTYCKSLTSVTIPNSVTSLEYGVFSDCDSLTSVTIGNSVTSIGNFAFESCISLKSVDIPNSVISIGNRAFRYCESLKSVDIPNSVTSIGDEVFRFCDSLTSVTIGNSVTSIGSKAFSCCISLTSVNIPNSVTSIGNQAFETCSRLTSITIPNSVTYIGNSAFSGCSGLDSITCLAETAPSLGSNVFYSTPSNKTLTVPFNASGYTSDWGNATWQKIYHKINEGEIKTLTNAFEITEDNKRGVINEGVLRIAQSGQLINQTETNVGGIIEIETPTLANDKWSFIGAPFNNYKLEVVKPGTKDISISLFDYTTGNWAEDFATIDDSVGSGEGFFAWSFAAEPTVFTTYGDGAETYNFETTPAYSLNNGAVNVTKNLTTHTEGGNWLALSNPYTFKLDVGKFLNERDSIKGGVVYRFNGSVWTPVSEGEINMTEGFFVNFENPGTHSVSFSKYYIYEPSKSKALETKDYITLNLTEGENVSKLRFAQNPKAKQGDDIFDANKLFSPLEITEPYFVTDGVALVKEEVKEYPYTATLNIRNYETKEITLSIDNIPEGVNVYLIDNGFEVKMNDGVEYNTRIIKGENADRFKVLFKKQHRLESIKDNQINISNNNRHISVKSDISNLHIEVYNQLGQKVFSTNEYNFTLSEQPAGSYVIKAYQGRFSESKKIVIE